MAHLVGVICYWSGSIATIPAGWKLCDGTQGTPDLRDSFVVAAGGSFNVDDVGGATTHNHGFTSDGHHHDLQPGTPIATGTGRDDETNDATDSGTTENGSSMPEYYALAPIMHL